LYVLEPSSDRKQGQGPGIGLLFQNKGA
jgi:hypothetical protein